MRAGVIAVGDPDTLFAVTPGPVDDLVAVGRPGSLLARDLDVILLIVGGAQEIDAPVGAASGGVKGDHVPIGCPGRPAPGPLAHVLADFHLGDVAGEVGHLQPQDTVGDPLDDVFGPISGLPVDALRAVNTQVLTVGGPRGSGRSLQEEPLTRPVGVGDEQVVLTAIPAREGDLVGAGGGRWGAGGRLGGGAGRRGTLDDEGARAGQFPIHVNLQIPDT